MTTITLILFYVLLRFVAVRPDDISRLLEDINSNVTILPPTSQRNLIQVITGKSLHHKIDICMYRASDISQQRLIDPVHALYTAVGCTVAQWTANKIYELVRSSPLFYQRKFHDNGIYTDAFIEHFQVSFKSFIWAIENNASLFMNALNNLIDTQPYGSYYKDMSVLENLTSLLVKIHFLIPIPQEPLLNDDIDTHFNVIRSLLEDIAAFQTYLSVNCWERPNKNKDSQFTDFWVTAPRLAHVFIQETFYFSNVTNINLILNDEWKCLPRQIILANFVEYSPYDLISVNANDISNTYVFINDTPIGTIKDIFALINKSHNYNMIFWYQDSVINAIMKLLFHELVSKLNKDKSYLQYCLQKIRDIHNIIIKDSTKFPAHLVKGFTVLRENAEKEHLLNIQELIDFHDAIHNVKLNISDERLVKDEYLHQLLKTIHLQINDFKCFQQSYRHLKYKYDKNDYRFTNSNMLLFANYNSIPENNYRTCDFVMAIYSICYRGQMFNEEGIDNELDKMYVKMTFVVLSTVRNYFLYIIKKNIYHLGLLEMAYAIAPILLNAITKPDSLDLFVTKRIFNVIIAKLNLYGNQHCLTKKKNLLFFNNNNFLEFGDNKSITKSINDFFQKFAENYTESHLRMVCNDLKMYNYINIKYLYKTFVEKSQFINQYENLIFFYWNGQKTTINNICKDIYTFFVNSNHLFVFYDVHFKFYIAIVFIEIKRILINTNTKSIEKSLRKLNNALNEFKHECFPQYLSPLITKIQTFLTFPKTLSTTDNVFAELHEYESEIDNEFTELNVVFDKESIYSNNFSVNFSLKNILKTIYSVINNELAAKVKNLNNYFKTFETFN